MAGLLWSEIGNLYLEAAGRSAAAIREKYTHLTEGYRRVASQLDIPELTQPDARVTIPADPGSPGDFLDYVEVDCDLSAIRSIFNVTDGHPIHLEDGGERGRDRYLQAGGLPPEGRVVRALRVGNRLYVRDRPAVETEIKVMFKVQVPDLDSTFDAKHPLTPAQYHLAIAHKAIESFWMIHPDKNEGGLRSYAPAREHAAQADAILAMTEDPKAVEATARRGRFRLQHLRFSPRSFR